MPRKPKKASTTLAPNLLASPVIGLGTGLEFGPPTPPTTVSIALPVPLPLAPVE